MELIKEIRWSGKHISLNDWYSSKHWALRKKQKDTWYKHFLSLLSDTVQLRTYRLEIYYNSRLDADNVITHGKLLNDFLKDRGWVVDDSPKFCKGVSITYDDSLGKMEYVIRIFGVRG